MHIDRQHGDRAIRRRGFSLIEVLVVVIILGLMLYLVTPNVDGLLPSSRMDGAARELANTIELVRTRAIITGVKHYIRFDLDNQVYYILDEENRSDSFFAYNPGGSLAPAHVPRGVRIKDIAFASGDIIGQGEIEVSFQPVGLFDDHLIHMANDRGDQITIEVNALTGIPEFYDYYKEIGTISEESLLSM